MKKALVSLAAAASLLGVGFAAPAYAATPAVSFTKIYFDSPGKDTGSNTSLNNEWVRLTNNTKKTVQLKGWTVRDKSSHVFTFKASYSLKPGARVYVHTGRGTNGKPDGNDVYWGSRAYIWNNTGDTATLKTGAGKVHDTCKWGQKAGRTKISC